MTDHNSQQGSVAVQKGKTKTADQKEKKGHMALRNNVWETRELLWDILKPSELRMVDAIITKTIKWRTDEAKITIQDLMEKTGQKHTHVYTILKELEAKEIILRRKVRHDFIIGLNPKFFGELLIKKHQDALVARRNKVKIVVDNSKNLYGTRTESVRNSDKICTEVGQNLYRSGTEKVRQDGETIDEKYSLNTLFKDISLKTSLKDSTKPAGETQIPEESYTLSGWVKKQQAKANRTPEEHKRIMQEQIAASLAEQQRAQEAI